MQWGDRINAFAAACAGIVAASSPEYASRAWCQVELLMAHAFMTTRERVFVVPDGFAGAEPQGDEWVTLEEVVVADPAAGQLTNDRDRAVIESLTGVAERSTAFSCWRVFVKTSTASVWMCCFYNVCCCCQFCCCCLRPAELLLPAGLALKGVGRVRRE